MDPRTKQVGVRELRHHLSQYLKRVTAGERFEVTERNQAVAILAPLPGRSSALDRLAASGRIIPARLDLIELGPPPEMPREMNMSEALEEQRRLRLAYDLLAEDPSETDIESAFAIQAEALLGE